MKTRTLLSLITAAALSSSAGLAQNATPPAAPAPAAAPAGTPQPPMQRGPGMRPGMQGGPQGRPGMQRGGMMQGHQGGYQKTGMQHGGPHGMADGGGMRGGFHIVPPGMWWRNPGVVTKLTLTPEQVKKMDDIFQQSRLQLIDLKANVEKQDVMLEPMLSANPPDTAKTLAQIDRVAQARADLEKANAKMLLGIRTVLTPDQWTKLHAQGGMQGGPGGGGGQGGPGDGRGPRRGGPGGEDIVAPEGR